MVRAFPGRDHQGSLKGCRSGTARSAQAHDPWTNSRWTEEEIAGSGRPWNIPTMSFRISRIVSLRPCLESHHIGAITGCGKTPRQCHPEPFAVTLGPFASLRVNCAKDLALPAQGKLREGSAIPQINDLRDSSSPVAPQNDTSGEFFRNLLRTRQRRHWSSVLFLERFLKITRSNQRS